MSFEQFDLSENIITLLNKKKITDPTEVQRKTFKHIIDNKDMIICSKTGSGKTYAYLLPLIKKLDINSNYIQVIILCPTQELAVQISQNTDELLVAAGFSSKSLFLIGEGNIKRQIESLKSKPPIVIGTPARVSQLISMKKLRVHDVKTLVIDEADKLIDKTYKDNVLSIRKSLMKFTQILLFSASIDKRTRKMANEISYNPVVMDFNQKNESLIPKTIKHYFIVVDRRERIETMRKIAKAINSDKVIVFINTKYDLDESYQKLQYHHYNVAALSGNQTKQEKKKALDQFKNNKIQYLLATDVAARGLQIDNINTVINVNLPEDSKEYIHRSGRCGRNGKEGLCISIITENELFKIKKYQKDFKINIVQRKLYQGKLVSK